MNGPPESAPVAADRIGLGIGSYLAAVFLFAIVDAATKWLGQTYEAVQIVFLRQLIALIPIAPYSSGGVAALRRCERGARSPTCCAAA